MDTINIDHIFIAAEHGFIGQHETAAQSHVMDSVDSVECVAGKGLKGDRFFGYKDNYKGQVTFFSKDVLEAVLEHTGAVACPPWAMRRNVMVSGIDLNMLIGREFAIGDVRFTGTEECAPCEWMNRSIGAGARDFLRGNGGLRAQILTNGVLTRGQQALSVS